MSQYEAAGYFRIMTDDYRQNTTASLNRLVKTIAFPRLAVGNRWSSIRINAKKMIALVLIFTLNLPISSSRADDGIAVPRREQTIQTDGPVFSDPDLLNGAATHSIPIVVPPGTGEVTPTVALTYHSGSAQDTWAGYGWSIHSSAVERSTRKGVPSFEASDLFEVDGEILVGIGASEYRTQRESFSRIRYVSESDSWLVEKPNGTKLYYGTYAAARVQNGSGVTAEWHLAEVEDPSGNVATYHYTQADPGTAYLNEIRYVARRQANGSLIAMPAQRVVRFVREARPDISVSFRGGFEKRLGQRLNRIDIGIRENSVLTLTRRYDLVFSQSADSGRSLLSELRSYGADAGQPNAKYFATHFSYRTNLPNNVGWELSSWDWPADVSLVDDDGTDQGVRLQDFDGDDLPDIFQLEVKCPGAVNCTVDWTWDFYRNRLKAGTRGHHLSWSGGFYPPLWNPALVPVYPQSPTSDISFPLVGNGQEYLYGTYEGTDLLPSMVDPTLNPSIHQSNQLLANQKLGLVLFTRPIIGDFTGDRRPDFLYSIDRRDSAFVSQRKPPIIAMVAANGRVIEPGLSIPMHTNFPGYGELEPIDTDETSWRTSQWEPASEKAQSAIYWSSTGITTFSAWVPLPGSTAAAELNGDGLMDLAVQGAVTSEVEPQGGGTLACVEQSAAAFVVYNRGNSTFRRDPTTANFSLSGCPGTRRVGTEFQICDFSDFEACRNRVAPFIAIDRRRWVQQNVYAGPSHIVGQWHPAIRLPLGNRHVDLNGDGLDDFISASIVDGSTILEARINNGAKQYLRRDLWAPPSPFFTVSTATNESEDHGFRFADVNGDRRVDLVRVSGAGSAVYLNNGGDLTQSPWSLAPNWNVPSGLTAVDEEGKDQGVRLLDLNGDGTADFIESRGGQTSIYLSKARVPDLLESVQFSEGGQLELEYATASDFAPTWEEAEQFYLDAFDSWDSAGRPTPKDWPVLSTFPSASPVLVATERSDGRLNTPVIRTEYSYAGGHFDVEEREFRGFGVVNIQHEGSRLVVESHQDDARRGLPRKRSLYDAQGNLREVIEYFYTEDADGVAPWVAGLAEVVTRSPSVTAPRAGKVSLQYERDAGGEIQYGRIRSITREGAVDYSTGVDLASSDNRISEFEYTPPRISDGYRVDLVSRALVREGSAQSGQLVRDTRLYYDSDETGTAVPERGLLTKRVEILNEAGSPNPTTRFTHDAYGNVESVATPRVVNGEGGSPIEIEYDDKFRTFVTAVTNQIGHRTEFGLEASDHICGTTAPLAMGLPFKATDPNDRTFGGSWRRCFDSFGRLTLAMAETEEHLEAIAYIDTPGAVSITKTRRARSPIEYRVSTQYIDGLGRVFREHVEGPQGETIAVERGFDSRGQVKFETVPHPNGQPTPGRRDFEYDYEGRLSRVVDEFGEPTLHQPVTPGVYSVVDPVGRTRRYHESIFGEIERVEEVESGSIHETSYSWNALGSIESIEDSLGNVTSIGYDLMGRRRSVIDPDTGLTEYGYDSDGNIQTQSSSLGTVVVQFDPISRPLLEYRNGELATSFAYDTAIRGIGLTSLVQDASGSLRTLEYNRLAQPVQFERELDGVTHTYAEHHDALGQVVRTVYPNGDEIVRQTDANGYLTAVSLNGERTIASDVQFSPNQLLRSWVTGGGVASQNVLDENNSLDEILVTSSEGQVLERKQYVFWENRQVKEVQDLRSPSLTTAFTYDDLGRLKSAMGPFGAAQSAVTLVNEFDPIGNVKCLEAVQLAGCVGGTQLLYPAPGMPRPHAPTVAGGQPVQYTTWGAIASLGSRSYSYDIRGQLSEVKEGQTSLISFVNDFRGMRVRTTESTPSRTWYQVTEDFEWHVGSGSARINVWIDGVSIATVMRRYTPNLIALASVPDPASDHFPIDLWILLFSAGMALSWISAQTWWGIRGARPVLRPAVGIALIFLVTWATAPVAGAAQEADGDLNGDGVLDIADLLIEIKISENTIAATESYLARGDVAPLGLAPENPSKIDVADTLLMMRAIRGDDVDGDGIASADELTYGASAFRQDSDLDGLTDWHEIHSTHTNPGSTDSDGDGIEDASDSDPLFGVLFFHSDHLGSPTLVTGAAGEVVQRLNYRPFGAVDSASPPSGGFGFTGQRYEEIAALSDYRARWLDSRLGRFLQPDSMIGDVFDPQQLNRYAYVGNDPVNFTDPTGHVEEFIVWGNNGERFPIGMELIDVDSLWASGWTGEWGVYPDDGSIWSNVTWVAVSPASGPGGSGSGGSGIGIGVAIAAGAVPYLGEALDLAVIADPSSTATERMLAGASLAVNVFVPILPNFGAAVRATRGVPKWPKGPREMDEFLGVPGRRVPDGPTTPGRNKVEWRPNKDTKITYEEHPYHPNAPEWHRGPHWHQDTPGQKHKRYLPGDDIPGYE